MPRPAPSSPSGKIGPASPSVIGPSMIALVTSGIANATKTPMTAVSTITTSAPT